MRASIVLLVNISAVLWLFVQPAYPQAMASDDTVMLKLNQVIRANGGLEVSYEIKNITQSDGSLDIPCEDTTLVLARHKLTSHLDDLTYHARATNDLDDFGGCAGFVIKSFFVISTQSNHLVELF